MRGLAAPRRRVLEPATEGFFFGGGGVMLTKHAVHTYSLWNTLV